MKQNKLLKKRLIFICFLILTTTLAFSQNTVQGVITSSDDGLPIPGASIIIKGTSSGTSSDFDGKFSFENIAPKNTLIISSLGFKSIEITVENQSNLKIKLDTDSQSLDEVVVVGYGTMKKSDITGSITSVSSKDFERQPLTQVDQALQGRAAGVAVNQTSGAPGAGMKVRIRGANSISGNNDPLFVVDGLIVADINSLNVNDIKSMEVLKDASATAIYGSRGANGVILLTTKTGKKGKTTVGFDYFKGFSKVSQKLSFMTPAQFAEGVNYAEGTEIYTPEAIKALENGGGENWQERLFQEAMATNVQLSFSGGSDAADYYISGNYNNAEGTIVDQQYKRYGVRVNLNTNISKKIKVGVNTYLSHEENSGIRANLATGLTWDPTTPAYTEDGDYNYSPLIPGIGNGQSNPLIAPENSIRENFNNQIVANANLNYKILDNLTLNISAGVDNNHLENNGYTSILVNNNGKASVLNREITRLQNTNRLTYTFDKNPNHKVKADLIFEQQKISNVFTESISEGFFSDNTTYKNLELGEIQRVDNRSISQSLQSWIGRVNYILLDRFIATATIRADGSSKFQKPNQWGYFPSGSLAWKMSDETFMENADAINNLKLRVSYGITGSQAIQPLATRSIPVISPNVNYPFTGDKANLGIAPSNRLANPHLTWETTAQFNTGFDLGLWNSKLRMTFDYYKKNTTDLLLDRTLPAYVGPTVVAQNVGEIENQGFELTLGWNVFENDDWQIGSTLSLSRNKNKVLSLADGDDFLELGNSYYTNAFPTNPTRVEVGKPISSFRGYQFEGVYQTDEADLASQFGRVPGDAKYTDINGDGIISSDDITNVGDGNPDFTWGWNWNVAYKNFDLNFVLLGSQGNDIYNFQRMRMMGLGAQQFHAVHADYLDRWTPTNPSDVPANRDTTELLSSQFVEDGSFVSLKNIVLGYTMDNVLKNIGLSEFRLYIGAENLFVITDYSGYDPESTASGNSDVDLGIDYNAYPINRTFTVGLNCKF